MITFRALKFLPVLLALMCGPLYSQNSQMVWGFADLHTHPASFLGFGSDATGQNGLMWGKPAHDGGLDLATSSLAANLALDLPPCPYSTNGPFPYGYTHNNAGGIDFIKLMTDSTIVAQLDQTSPGWTHAAQGAPGFQGWPAALSVDHQAMHINNIKRAFDGGLRLMFAAATDDELLSKLWNQGFNLGGNPMPVNDPNFDFQSAIKQLTYITNLVKANSSWMQIVSTPADARAAINGNPPKLAVVLSLEMDALTLSQIQQLVQQFKVAHVIPVHLADNSFGGAAIYEDNFNALSNFINGFPESGLPDPNVNFSLATPVATLTQNTLSTILPPRDVTVGDVVAVGVAAYGPQALAASWLWALDPPEEGALGYGPTMPTNTPPIQSPGQINSRDLNQSNFYGLMEMGLMLDVAHMGQTTASSALRLAQQFHYPLMDSHTGIRCDSPNPTTGPGFTAVSCSTPFGSPPNATTAGVATSGSGAIAGGTLEVNERSLPTSHLDAIRQLGGVIGLGEVPATLGSKPALFPDPDPVTTWIKNYSIALALMGGKGVAIGTDANGLSPLIQVDTIATSGNPYTINAFQQFGCPACPSLPAYSFGGRTYNFQTDGIANYGLLPDFIQAASQSRPVSVPVVFNQQCVQACESKFGGGSTPCAGAVRADEPIGHPILCPPGNEIACIAACPHTGGGTVPGPVPTAQITALFHSAEDTIEMWEKVQNALVITSPTLPVAQTGQSFSQTMTARGGTPPYSWSLQSGSTLPPGLAMSAAGNITGKPTIFGAYHFIVVVSDSSTPQISSPSLPFTLAVISTSCTGTNCPDCGPDGYYLNGKCYPRPINKISTKSPVKTNKPSGLRASPQ